MSPKLASLLCWLFIAWLFRRDAKWHKVSLALWIPLAWTFIIGSKPISVWFGADPNGGADDYVEGSPFDRMFFLALIVAGWVVLVRRKVSWNLFFKENRWLTVYFLYLGLSAFWSDYTFVSIKRWIKDVGNIIMVLVVLTEQNPVDAVKALLARSSYLMISLSVLVVKYYPELGRYYDRWTYQPRYGGITTNKNILGMTLFVCGVSLFWMLFEWWRTRPRGRDRYEPGVYLVMLLMTFWLLGKAQSSTALACTVLGCAILVGLQFPSIRSKAGRLGAYSLGFALLFLFLHVALDLGGVFVALLGRDLTFTGRTDIWANLLKEPVNPILGEGFYSFWMGDRVQRLSEKYFYLLNEAHNGYLETYLNNGLVGVCLLAVYLGSVAQRIQRKVLAGSGFGTFQLAFLAAIIVYNFTEATFNRLDLVWFLLLLATVEPPVQPAAEIRPSPKQARGSPEERDARKTAAEDPMPAGSLRSSLSLSLHRYTAKNSFLPVALKLGSHFQCIALKFRPWTPWHFRLGLADFMLMFR